MRHSTAEDVRDVPDLAALPDSPVSGVEPLLTWEQLKTWMGVSDWYLKEYGSRDDDPLPLIGTARVKRALPSEVIEWMRRNSGSI